jgi:hypothetical protein
MNADKSSVGLGSRNGMIERAAQGNQGRHPSSNKLVHAAPRLTARLAGAGSAEGNAGKGAGHRFAHLAVSSRGVVNTQTLSETEFRL